jgi:hypothetical protein
MKIFRWWGLLFTLFAASGDEVSTNRFATQGLADFNKAAGIIASNRVNEVSNHLEQVYAAIKSCPDFEYTTNLFHRFIPFARTLKGDFPQIKLLAKYVQAGLQDPERLPVWTEAGLIESFPWDTYNNTFLNTGVWVEERRRQARWWLHALERGSQTLDPTFNPNDQKNWPSTESALVAFPDPASVKDPKQRADLEVARQTYEQDLKDNARKRERMTAYTNNKLMLDFLVNYATRNLKILYSRQPSNVDELSGLLTKYNLPKDLASGLVAAVRRESE